MCRGWVSCRFLGVFQGFLVFTGMRCRSQNPSSCPSFNWNEALSQLGSFRVTPLLGGEGRVWILGAQGFGAKRIRQTSFLLLRPQFLTPPHPLKPFICHAEGGKTLPLLKLIRFSGVPSAEGQHQGSKF